MLVESIFPTTFNYLIASGFWLPTNLDNKFRPFYYALGLFSWLSDVMLLIPMIMFAMLSEESFSKLMIDNLFFLATLLNWLAKTTYLLIRRSNVIDVAYKCGQKRWTQFRDEKEDEIIRESKKSENFISRYCGAMVSANIISNVLRPVTSANPEHKLVVDAYEFCDRSQPSCFWFCYLAQSVGFFFAAVFIVGYDCLLYNLILRCSAHFALVAHRMQGFRQGVTRVSERRYYRDCFRDHQAALIIMDDLYRIFAETVFLQFCSSILVICTTVFFLSKQEPMSPDFVSTAVYLFCMLVQTFLYCWFGYKLTEINPKMMDAIYQIDWVNLQNKTKNMIRFTLLMTSRKIEPFDNAFVSLSPVSFINIVKLSYSTFMVLTKTS